VAPLADDVPPDRAVLDVPRVPRADLGGPEGEPMTDYLYGGPASEGVMDALMERRR
jgi:hypothetical protein